MLSRQLCRFSAVLMLSGGGASAAPVDSVDVAGYLQNIGGTAAGS